ncbi:hypothetical protein A3J33_02520 [candidate division WWE3 bacterium RIFCSPLOWO2_02_FULL_53_10]|uniref:DUF4870 domain-containing protein n=1 Tax=candidate division WWE3 bacterium RIFCSPLOWO2_02_FULL_53_10 TaxID=1802629 RepID=A0A1F4WMK5_UNCKA|nr:MAG: hypothetical protein A3J33_02520 [candidate division WWE3 bacterium RIFCSPLOWO2_02_FULL_53_10]
MAKTQIGLEENLTGALAYVLGFVSGIFFLLTEKENRFVRFHAMQSTVLTGGYFVLNFVIGYIPVVNVLWLVISVPLGLALLVLWLYLMYQAYQGKEYKLPVVGDIAEKQLGKLKV